MVYILAYNFLNMNNIFELLVEIKSLSLIFSNNNELINYIVHQV